MKEKLEALKAQALEELAAVTSLDALKDLRVKYLGSIQFDVYYSTF